LYAPFAIYHWYYAKYSPCSASCGFGVVTATLGCRVTVGVVHTDLEDSSLCYSQAQNVPPVTLECAAPACLLRTAAPTSMPMALAPMPTVMPVTPAPTPARSLAPTPAASYNEWRVSEWQGCSVSCGQVTALTPRSSLPLPHPSSVGSCPAHASR
jgi:hypothetical protein